MRNTYVLIQPIHSNFCTHTINTCTHACAERVPAKHLFLEAALPSFPGRIFPAVFAGRASLTLDSTEKGDPFLGKCWHS